MAIQFLRYQAWQTDICNFGACFVLLPLENLKNQNFENMKQTFVPKIIIIWCMAPEIWCETDKIFCHFGNFLSFYLLPLTTPKIKILTKWKNTWRCHHFTFVYQNSQSYDVCFLRYGVQHSNRHFLSFLGNFLSFYPSNSEN